MSKLITLPVVSVIFGAVLLLSGCTATELPAQTMTQNVEGSALDELGFGGLDARQVVERLDEMPLAERPGWLSTSVEAHQVLLTGRDGNTEKLPLPDDLVYVSAAPYVSQTHDCYYHSPTSCIGELRNTEVDVSVTDAASGETALNETMRTFDNGFIGLWLPRDIDAIITIQHEDQVATSTLSTSGNDVQTCVTTLQLA
ncbi:MAG: CueP family metal-binding protein [Leucobacter sp.]